MAETAELETKQEEASHNGHDASWKTFDSDQELLQHILSKKPAEKLVDIPEWEIQVLCRSLSANARIEVDAKAWDAETKTTDFRRVLYLIAMRGCYNPTTGKPFFTEKSEKVLMGPEGESGPIARLAFTVLRLSRLLASDMEQAKKN